MLPKMADRSGQMTVEFAVVFPVMLVMAAIALHAMVYAGECARFDEAVRNAIRLEVENGTDRNDALASIERTVRECMDRDVEVSASSTEQGVGQVRYTVELRMPATLFGMPLGDVMGFSIPPLEHRCEMVACVRREAVVL